MALLVIREFHQIVCRSIKPINSGSLFSIFLFKTVEFHRSICTKAPDNSFPPLDITNINHTLISIFTKKPFSPNNPELNNLAPFLTTKIVEAVLNGFKSWKAAYFFFTWSSNQFGYKHNIYTYNAMASILSRARQNAPLGALAMDIINSNCTMSPGALGFFIRCLGSVGLVQEANFLFDQVKLMGLCVPNIYSYNCLLEAISNSNSVDLVEMRLKQIHDTGWEFDKYTYTPVLKVYCNAGKFDKALEVFNEMHRRGWVDSHVFSILVVSFTKWSEVDKTLELIERMDGHNIRLNEKTFYVLIHGFVRESRVDKALQLFNKMQESGFSPDVSLYDVLIGGLCKTKEIDKALHLYREMKELGIRQDIGILSKILSSFSEEEEFVRFLEENREYLDVESMTLLRNSVLSSLIDKGFTEKAYNLLLAMKGVNPSSDAEVKELFNNKKMVSPNPTSFSIVIDGLLKAGRLDLALTLFRNMDQAGCKPNLSLYNLLISGLCNANRLEDSYALLEEMKESGFEPNQFTHNSIFGCLCRKRDTVGALDLVKKMRVHGHEPWIKYCTLLVKELCKHGRAVEAGNFLADLVQEGFLPDIIAYSAAIDGLIETQEVDRAMELFHDICARGYCPDVVAYNILIKGLCKAQRVEETQRLLDDMAMKGLKPSVVTYNSLIDGWCKSGEIDRALICLSEMSRKEIEPNVITYTTFIHGLCNAQRPDEAIILWNQMRRKGCAANRISFMALIHGLCKCGRPDAALSHLGEMKEKEMKPDFFVYAALVSAFLTDLNPLMAFEILKEMVDNGNLPDPLDKNFLVLKDTICKLSEDKKTSLSVKSLIAGGKIPNIRLSDIGSEGGFEPTS